MNWEILYPVYLPLVLNVSCSVCFVGETGPSGVWHSQKGNDDFAFVSLVAREEFCWTDNGTPFSKNAINSIQLEKKVNGWSGYDNLNASQLGCLVLVCFAEMNQHYPVFTWYFLRHACLNCLCGECYSFVHANQFYHT